MLKTLTVCAALCVAVTLSLPAVGAAQGASENSVPLNNVPVWILAAANQAAKQFFGPAAVILTAQTDPEGEFVTYEFTGAAAGSIGFEIDIFPDGSVDEVEEIIESSEVPADVLAQLLEFFPNFTPTLVEKSTRPQDNGLNGVWYEFEGRLRGQDVDVEVNALTKSILLEAN